MLEIYLAIAGSMPVTAVITWLLARRKNRAEAKQSELKTIEGAIAIWRKMAEDLACQLTTLTDENRKLRAEVRRLKCTSDKIIRALEALSPDNLPEQIAKLKETLKNG